MRRGEWADPKDGRITLSEWWVQWSGARVVEYATQKRAESHWRTHVQPRWGSTKLSAITAWDVEGWVAQMRKDGVGATSLKQSVMLLRQMLADATRHKMISADPTATVVIPTPPKHVDRFLTREEFGRLLECTPGDRDKAMMTVMAYAGLRWGEVAGLHAHRVDLGRRQLLVVETLRRNQTIKNRPKSDAGQRVVPIVDDVAEVLEGRLGGGLVFPGVDYTNWRRRVFVPARDRAGLDDPQPTIHDLRHTFGSWLAEAGVPPNQIQALMGHGSLRATERYLHATDDRFRRMVAAFPSAASPAGSAHRGRALTGASLARASGDPA